MYTTILLTAGLLGGCILKDALLDDDTAALDPCAAQSQAPVTLSTQAGETDYTLSPGRACADVLLFARSADATLALGFETTDRILQDAHEKTAAIERTYVVGEDTIDFFKLQMGVDVGSNYCSDIASFSTVEETYTAISGTVVITATPDGEYEPDGYDAQGWVEATLSSVLFEDEAGDQLLLPEMTVCDFAGYSIP